MKYGKKVAAVLFVVAILSSMSVWAQAKEAAGKKEAKSDSGKRKTLVEGVEFTVTPAIGLSATASSLKPLLGGTSSIKASATQFNIGLQGTMIGLPVAQKADWMDNFTSILNMDMGVGGKIILKDDVDTTNASVSGGVLFQMSLLAGYKFTVMEKFHLTPAIGLGYASSGITGSDDGWPVVFGGGTFSIPLYADVKYFFTDLIGIDLNIINSLEFGTVTATTPVFGALGTSSFRNIFVLKVGPVFRF